MFVGSFPVVSETFILRQITGLLDLGHEVDIFANVREEGALIHPDVTKYRLLERAMYVNGPAESAWGRARVGVTQACVEWCRRRSDGL